MFSLFFIVLPITLLAAISPGPDALVVMRNSLSHGRKSGIATAIGVGLGVLIHVGYCIAGVGLIISQSILLFQTIKIVGALYLLYLAYQLIRSQGTDLKVESREESSYSLRKDFISGFLTNVLNPKATLFFLAVFTQVIDPSTSLMVQGILGVSMASVVGIWFIFLSCILGSPILRERIMKLSKWVDRAMGVLLGGLGVKVLLSSR